MEKYNHIQIERQENVGRYRGHSNPIAPKPPQRVRKEHGEKLQAEIVQASRDILSARKDAGIETDNLMVLEIQSEALSGELLESLINSFRLTLVEETPLAELNRSKLVVQFDNQDAVNEFNNERSLWESDSHDEAKLTYAKRRDLFCCIDNVRCLTKEDRIGKRLKIFVDKINDSARLFVVNIDVWYNNDRSKIIEIEEQIKRVLGTQGSELLGDLFEISGLLLGRAKVNEYSLNALLNLDIICLVELPFEAVMQEPNEIYPNDFKPIVNDILDDGAPLAAVLDSGVFTGNPLLKTVVVAEEDFDHQEETTTDLNGHGTGVAGIVVYGDLSGLKDRKVFTPLVRVYNGKILHKEGDNACFREDKRPEEVVYNAIKYFHEQYGCRIFNLSVGNDKHVYNGGRQFPWASMLDDLSRELDIVIVVSAGNVAEPKIPVFNNREELLEKTRDNLFNPEHRLIDPATSALSITVGSITRASEPVGSRISIMPVSVGKTDYPSAFTRIGKGVNKAIKPEFVDYGGNISLGSKYHGSVSWDIRDFGLMEPTLYNGTDRVFKGYCGTSFSAPHVTHIAARLERSLERQLAKKPSANLIRAMLANSASCTETMQEWGMNSNDELYSGKDNPKQERLMRLYGYGKVSELSLTSTDNAVTLFAEDTLLLRDFHLYKIPVPSQFIKVRSNKSITVSLAYNPMTRMGRKEYLANNLWIEIFRRIDEQTLFKYKAKRDSGIDIEEAFKNLPDEYKIKDFVPGYNVVQKSTLQQRRWQKGSRGGSDLSWPENEKPYIYILVSGKERFRCAQQEQDYALCVTFTYESEEKIDLYNQLRDNVKLKETVKVQARVRV